MTKVLLTTLNSKFIHSSLALYSINSFYEDHKLKGWPEVSVREFNINQRTDYIYTEIMWEKWDAICFSVNIWNVEETLKIASMIKLASPSTRIVMGGPEAGYDPLDFLKNNNHVDICVKGEGEKTFFFLCQALFKTEALIDIKGISYRDREKNRIFINEDSTPLDLNELSFAYKHLDFPKNQLVYYETVRGCPFKCSYCLSSTEKGIRAIPIYRVLEELDFLLEKEPKTVKFVDRTFNWSSERTKKIMDYIVEKDKGITTWHLELSPYLIDESIIEAVNRGRRDLFQFEVGIQSTNKKTLKEIDRDDDIEKALKKTRELIDLERAHVHVDLIAGLPYEDFVTFKTSFNRVYDLEANHIQVGFLKLLKGTKIREESKKYEYVYQETPPYRVLQNSFMKSSDLSRLYLIEELLDLYYNRGGFQESLKYLTGISKSPFSFYEEFSRFYQLKGYQRYAHKKEDLFKILYEYIEYKGRSERGVLLEGTLFLRRDMEKLFGEDLESIFKRKGWRI